MLAYDHAAAGQLIQAGINGLLVRLDDTAAFCSAAYSASSSNTCSRFVMHVSLLDSHP